jgi:hypothetical protein
MHGDAMTDEEDDYAEYFARQEANLDTAEQQFGAAATQITGAILKLRSSRCCLGGTFPMLSKRT